MSVGEIGFIGLTIDSNFINYNISATNPLQRTLNASAMQNIALQKDMFQTGAKAANQKTNNNSTVPLTVLFSPKQLLKSYSNQSYVEKLIESNPELQELINENGLDGKVYPENIAKISNTHLTTTTAYALQIANKMNLSLADRQMLEQACVFHDFGKILIPHEVLDKPAELSDDERKIMKLHSEFGYQLLSKTGMNDRVLNMVKNHHMPQSENSDILGQILSVADIYSALREQRSYKAPLSEKEALQILDQKAKNGEVSTEVVNTLKSVVVNSMVA